MKFKNVTEFMDYYFPSYMEQKRWDELMTQPPEVIGRTLADKAMDDILAKLDL